MAASRFVLASLLLLGLIGLAHCITFQVLAHREECFLENVSSGTDLGLVFQVTAGGFLDIDVRILAPDDSEVYSGRRETEGKYFFVAHSSGYYKFCFSNKMSTLTPKSVSMQIKVGKAVEDKKAPNALVDETIQPAILQLADGLHSITAEERYMRIREAVHRDTTESTNARVLWWSILETASLVAMSVWQIIYLRRFFEVKRPV